MTASLFRTERPQLPGRSALVREFLRYEDVTEPPNAGNYRAHKSEDQPQSRRCRKLQRGHDHGNDSAARHSVSLRAFHLLAAEPSTFQPCKRTSMPADTRNRICKDAQ